MRAAEARHRALRVHVQVQQRRGVDGAERVELGLELAKRRQDLGRLLLGSEHGPVDDDEPASAERLGNVGQRRDLQQASRGGHLVGRRLCPLDVAAEHVGCLLPGPDEHPGDEGVDAVEGDLDRDDDAEAAAAAAQRPEEIGVLHGVGTDERAVGGDELDGEHALGREAVLAREPADAAAERVADDADVRRGAVQGGQAGGVGGAGDVLPPGARLDAGAACVDVDLDAAQVAHVDQERPGERARRGTVTGALDGDLQVALARVGDGGDHVVHGGGQRDDRGALVDRQVPGLAGVVPAHVVGEDELVGAGGVHAVVLLGRTSGREWFVPYARDGVDFVVRPAEIGSSAGPTPASS